MYDSPIVRCSVHGYHIHIPRLHHTLTWLGHTLVIAEERTVSVRTHYIQLSSFTYIMLLLLLVSLLCAIAIGPKTEMQIVGDATTAKSSSVGELPKKIYLSTSSARKRSQMRESSVSAHRYPCTYLYIYYRISYNINAQVL